MKKVRIWDLPTRLFHWSLVIVIAGALLTQWWGGEAMTWHFRFGYAALTLVLFRVLWGLIGPRYARFTSFIHSPPTVFAYLRGQGAPAAAKHSGHNPLGGLSVLAMLAVILLQAGSGLFANDDISTEGPLARLIDKDLSDQVSWLHAKVSGKGIYGLIAVHLLAIVYHRLRRKTDLVTPMFTGDKAVEGDALPANDGRLVRTLGVVLMSTCAWGVYRLVHW